MLKQTVSRKIGQPSRAERFSVALANVRPEQAFPPKAKSERCGNRTPRCSSMRFSGKDSAMRDALAFLDARTT
jgi:hypothetical protein